jgi:murein DD-endopeptidase MepM/ murein hydrolase activator NlpD
MRIYSFAVLFFAAASLCSAAAPRPDPRLSVEARAIKPGEILLLTVEGNDMRVPPTATFRGQSLPFFPSASTGTWLALAALDLDTSTGPALLSAMLHAPGGRVVRSTQTLTIEPGNFPIVELKVDQKFVTPDKSDAERAEAEANRLHKLFAAGEGKRLFEGHFDSPIPGAATARFGERRVFNGEPKAPHSGMDLKAKSGVPVRATAAGRVVLADPLFYAGKTIVIDHGLGLTTLYAHLSKFLVKTGDMVKKGQVIGHVGATGRVTGPHLHWAAKLKNSRIDPFSLVFLDLDAKLKPRLDNPLKRSALCLHRLRPDAVGDDLPPAPKWWSKPSNGLRARARPAKAIYGPGENVSLLVEIQNPGKKNIYLDFVRDAAVRPLVLGVGEPLRPFEALASSQAVAGALTEQVKIPPRAILCFEQNMSAAGPLLANQTTSWPLIYGTEFLYASTSTIRAGLWRGRLALKANVVVSSTTR